MKREGLTHLSHFLSPVNIQTAQRKHKTAQLSLLSLCKSRFNTNIRICIIVIIILNLDYNNQLFNNNNNNDRLILIISNVLLLLILLFNKQ